MITLYTFATPNGWRASIALEELGLAYDVHTINLTKGEQLAADYMAISPIGKIPALVEDGEAVFGSTAILTYLADTRGKLMPADAAGRRHVHNWMAFAASDFGPTLGSSYFFRFRASEPQPVAIERFASETRRCYAALEARLGAAEYLAGGDYSIADIACFAFVAAGAAARPDLFDDRPNLRRWHDLIAARPAVQRGMAVPG